MVVYKDTQSAIAIARNSQSHSQTKHIVIRYHFVHEQVSDKTVELQYCSTSEMLLMKGLKSSLNSMSYLE